MKLKENEFRTLWFAKPLLQAELKGCSNKSRCFELRRPQERERNNLPKAVKSRGLGPLFTRLNIFVHNIQCLVRESQRFPDTNAAQHLMWNSLGAGGRGRFRLLSALTKRSEGERLKTSSSFSARLHLPLLALQRGLVLSGALSLS